MIDVIKMKKKKKHEGVGKDLLYPSTVYSVMIMFDNIILNYSYV